MSSMQEIDVLVSEVGPRDGLQSIKRTMPTAYKLRWISALAARRRARDRGRLFRPGQVAAADGGRRRGGPGRGRNSGPERARACAEPQGRPGRRCGRGAHAVTLPISASRAHSQANIRKTPGEAMDEVGRICAWRDSLPAGERFVVDANVATAFDCTMEGPVSEAWVISMALRLAQLGADAVGLSDTTGYGNPAQVKRLFTRLRRELGDKVGEAHLHNTRGQGLANTVAALEAGVTILDASQGGIGGCPYAPGATGNIVTEDLVFMLESMGLRTGIDIERLIDARQIIVEALPGEALYGHVPDAGLMKGFVPAFAKRQAHG